MNKLQTRAAGWIEQMPGRVLQVLTRAGLAAGLASVALASPTQVPGCGTAGLATGTYTLPHGGLTRSCRLYVPPGYRKNVASRMVVVFHGWGGNEDEILTDSAVIGEAGARGYILVAPRGLGSGLPDNSNNSWTFRGSATGLDGDGANPKIPGDASAICDAAITPGYRYPSCKAGSSCNTCSWTQCQDDDVDFTLALVRHIETKLCIDTAHVYASGGSKRRRTTAIAFTTPARPQSPRVGPLRRVAAPLGKKSPSGARTLRPTAGPTVLPRSHDGLRCSIAARKWPMTTACRGPGS